MLQDLEPPEAILIYPVVMSNKFAFAMLAFNLLECC